MGKPYPVTQLTGAIGADTIEAKLVAMAIVISDEPLEYHRFNIPISKAIGT